MEDSTVLWVPPAVVVVDDAWAFREGSGGLVSAFWSGFPASPAALGAWAVFPAEMGGGVCAGSIAFGVAVFATVDGVEETLGLAACHGCSHQRSRLAFSSRTISMR
jgi:hypothetical protein